MKIKGKKLPTWLTVLLGGILAVPVVLLLLRVETLDLRDAEAVYVSVNGGETFCVEDAEQVESLTKLFQGSVGFLAGEGLPKTETPLLSLRFSGASVDLTVVIREDGIDAASNGLRFGFSAKKTAQLKQLLALDD